jgi:hypothetical protein
VKIVGQPVMLVESKGIDSISLVIVVCFALPKKIREMYELFQLGGWLRSL